MTTIIRTAVPRKRTAAPPRPRRVRVEPGGGYTTRRAIPLPPDAWPKYRTDNRVRLFKILTIRPDDYLTTIEIRALWDAAGFPEISDSALAEVIRGVRAIGWIQTKSSKARTGTRRLGYRLAPRPLATVKYYVGRESGRESGGRRGAEK
jgi:hypothetical protein